VFSSQCQDVFGDSFYVRYLPDIARGVLCLIISIPNAGDVDGGIQFDKEVTQYR